MKKKTFEILILPQQVPTNANKCQQVPTSEEVPTSEISYLGQVVPAVEDCLKQEIRTLNNSCVNANEKRELSSWIMIMIMILSLLSISVFLCGGADESRKRLFSSDFVEIVAF